MTVNIFTAFDSNTSPGPTAPPPWTNSDAAYASFIAALSSFSTHTFEGDTVGATTVVMNFGSITGTLTGGFIYSDAGGDDAGRFAISPHNFWDTDTSTFSLIFSAGVSAFGFYATDVGDFGGILTIKLTDQFSNVTSYVVPAPPTPFDADGSVLFWGFYQDDGTTEYVSVAFNNSTTADAFGFDNFTLGFLGGAPVTRTQAMIFG